MKHYEKKLILLVGLLLIGSLVTLSGCKKDDDSGYQPVGNYGDANISAANTVTLNSGDWVPSGSYFMSTVNMPTITQAIVDNGSVLVYRKNGTTGSAWQAMPYTWINVTWGVIYQLNSVILLSANSDGTQTGNPGTQTFKIVVFSKAGRYANPNLNWNNYEEVKKAFNLAD